METRCTCGAGCPTFGACMRRKGLRIGWCKSQDGLDATAEKAKNTELALYKSARDQGVQPLGTRMEQSRHALDVSDLTGRPFDGAKPLEAFRG